MLELNKIYNMDCKEGMKLLDDNSIDLVVTDPPYKVISGGGGNGANSIRPKGILTRHDGKLFNHTYIKPNEWIPDIYRILKEGTHCYIFTNTLNFSDILLESRNSGFKLHNILVWEKNNCTPSQFYMKNCEYILFLRKGKAKWINDIGGSKTVHKFNNIIGNKKHPTEKPTDLLDFYINNSSNISDIVFDPFMGSGSTAISCLNTNRQYIGFELDETYYNIAEKRIDDYKNKLKL